MVKYDFLTILLFILIIKGCHGCSTTNIKVIVGLSGKEIQGKPEYAVLVYNTCDCPVGGIILSCPDFKTIEPIDPTIFVRYSDGRCLINQGHNIYPGTYLGFSYAWDGEFNLPAIDSYPVC
ncbi:Beta-1,3-N-Acetylglucosaminyltransferase family protein [Heracleum sosnowskyi]|uniref:Beta-1,3-N-Acetylglucosaminyltransferase family protein n=1 Tax=Heracleum sosnowskyi TaxID=360622 RepID=A0AAD8HWT6_9APIA|nr:Beta-1,3-N-Acetylglucosaminyltransferase family protein [Heracleum sosnowskyi]